ncbi:MAG: hypothetical protein LBN34_06495 [Clostridiales Family XIII bacterium]|jgi:hypothetical protein|nr:hypothetical protein [Clostridiales Family XIII bacterium]
MKTQEHRTHRIKVRLTDEEVKQIDDYASACGLRRSQFMRMLAIGKYPKPKPPMVFWEIVQELYNIHNTFNPLLQNENFKDVAIAAQKDIEEIILEFERTALMPEKVKI